MVLSRKESLLFHPKRHATIIKMKTGAKQDGTLMAHDVEIYGDGGAYASLSNHVMLRATTHAAGPEFRAQCPRQNLCHVYQQYAVRRVPRLWCDPKHLCHGKPDG